MSKNVSWEVQKAIAMAEAMTELNMGIVEAAKFAASCTGFSQEVVRRWAFVLSHSTPAHWKMSISITSVWSFLRKGAKHVEMQHQFCTKFSACCTFLCKVNSLS